MSCKVSLRARVFPSLALATMLLGLGGLVLPSAGFVLPAMAGSAAVDPARVTRLADQMQLTALLAVVREEGIAYGDGLDQDLLAGAGGVAWRAEVARVYDPRTGRAQIEATLAASLAADPVVVQALETFYAGPLGHKVAGLEVAARRALLDPAAKAGADRAWQAMAQGGDPRAGRLKALVTGQGLIEQNVQGTLNANLALYKGLKEGGGLKAPLSDDQALAEVAGQEAQVRAATEAWLYPYLALAYQPLSDAEFDQYLAFLATPEGTRANQAMFLAFDALFTRISHDLGLAAAHRMAGQAI
jgi:hypothetical protein